jgi:hypothetical protein
MSNITHLGIIAGGLSLLSTVVFDDRNDRAERASWSEAGKLLRDWRAVRSQQQLEIVPLSRRSYNGWEAAGR